MRHAVVLLLAASLSGCLAMAEMLSPARGLRSGAVLSAPPVTAAPPKDELSRDLDAYRDVQVTDRGKRFLARAHGRIRVG